MSTPPSTSAPRADDAFEATWAQWRAKGAAEDRQLQTRAVTASVILFSGIFVALAVALYAR